MIIKFMPAKNISENLVAKLGKFEIGDMVSSCPWGLKPGRHMPGVGEIIAIRADRERPYICAHNDKLYQFKATEIDHHDFY